MINQETIKGMVRDIIANIAPDEDLGRICDDLPLRDQLKLDSMDFLDIVMELRRKHKIEVPQEDYSKLATLNSCAEYLTPKFKLVS